MSKTVNTYMALPCIVCGGELETCSMPNQPLDGLAFSTGGAYGTTLFDPMDGSTLEVNVCDPCLRKASEQGRVLFYGVERVSLDADSFLMRKPNFKLWDVKS